MERSTVIAMDAAPPRAAAWLTLKSGASGWCFWSFDACDIGATITVGACERCDWQVVAPGVAPIALLFTGQTLFVKSERTCEQTRLNGVPLWPGWVPLEHGDEVELGAARLAVSLSGAASSTDSTRRISSTAARCPTPSAVLLTQAKSEHAVVVPSQQTPRLELAPALSKRGEKSMYISDELTLPLKLDDRRNVSAKPESLHEDLHVITAPQWGARSAATPSGLRRVPQILDNPYPAERSSFIEGRHDLKELAAQLQGNAQMRPIRNRIVQRPQTPERSQTSGSAVEPPQAMPGYRRQTVKQWQTAPERAQPKPRSSFASSAVIAKTSAPSYAALGVLTVLAYAGWLVVLDYL